MKSSSSLSSFGLLLFIVMLPISVFAQGWEWQNPKPTGQRLNDVKFINSTTGWAVGNGGTILHTINGGISWTFQSSGRVADLYQVSFIDSNQGWIAGDHIFLATEDGGLNWQQRNTPVFDIPSDLFFTDQTHGWLIGTVYSSSTTWYSRVYFTDDGGINWETQPVDSTYFRQIQFIDNNNGWIIGYSTHLTDDHPYSYIFRTIDGGHTWQRQIFEECVFFSISVLSSGEGWCSGQDYGVPGSFLRHTTNSGTNWIRQYADTHNSFYHIQFIDHDNGWAIGEQDYNSVILHTTNGGGSWQTQYSQTGNSRFSFDLASFSIANLNNGCVVSMYGTILTTTNGGSSWKLQTKGYADWLTSVACIDTNNAWAVGTGNVDTAANAGAIFHTSDGGTSWHVQGTNLPTAQYNYVTFVNANSGWAVVMLSAVFIHTTDGGNTWQRLSSPTYISGLSFIDANNGWVSGNRRIYRTTNGGVVWRNLSIDTTIGIGNSQFLDANNGWCIGNRTVSSITQHTIHHTTDGGSHWQQQYSSASDLLSRIQFVDTQYGWASSADPYGYTILLVRTTNGGGTWSRIELPTSFKKVKFVDRNIGWGVGEYLCKTTDGGATWIEQSNNDLLEKNDIAAANASVAWVVGMGGSILRTTDGGSTFVQENQSKSIPDQFILYTSYPNPFNATTTISYELPRASNIELKIFDLQGREVQTMYRGYQQAGSYRATFDGSAHASGTYFVRLQAGTSVQTRKIVLLK